MLRLSLAFATAGLTASQTTTAAATATAAATTTNATRTNHTCDATCEYVIGNSSRVECDTLCERIRVHGNSASVVTGLAAVMMSLLLTFA